MRERKVTRYYCDHCKKSGGQKAAIVKHEKVCTKNPERVCGFCAFAKTATKKHLHSMTLESLIAVLQAKGLEALLESAGECPGCCFAAIVQSRATQVRIHNAVESVRAADLNDQRERDWLEAEWKPKEGWLEKHDYDFRAECQKFWYKMNPYAENCGM